MTTLSQSTTLPRRPLAVAAAALAALAVYVVAVPVLGADLYVPSAGMTVGPLAVTATALVAALAGWALLAILERRTAHAGRIWRVAAILAGLLSLAGPLTGGASLAATATLLVLHVAVATVLIVSLPGRPR